MLLAWATSTFSNVHSKAEKFAGAAKYRTMIQASNSKKNRHASMAPADGNRHETLRIWMQYMS